MRGLAILLAAVASLMTAAPALAKEPKISPSDRAAIDATLDVFVNHAVKRKDIAKSYDVVTPELRGGMTRAQWANGSIPVYPYPAAGKQFHKWTIQYRTKDEVAIELILAPRARYKKKLGQFLFHVYLQPRNGKWLVDSFMPGATFAPEGKAPVVQAAADFQASPGGQTYNRNTGKREHVPVQISANFIWIPFAALGLLLAGLAAWGVTQWFRARRVDLPRAVPPAPLSIPADGTRARPRHRP
ncbi:MAG TPA: hypothetical protein VFT86_10155 [Gaiellaceae bacterium]|nr:hypothetical protein [Gaiellaceae bacterium]